MVAALGCLLSPPWPCPPHGFLLPPLGPSLAGGLQTPGSVCSEGSPQPMAGRSWDINTGFLTLLPTSTPEACSSLPEPRKPAHTEPPHPIPDASLPLELSPHPHPAFHTALTVSSAPASHLSLSPLPPRCRGHLPCLLSIPTLPQGLRAPCTPFPKRRNTQHGSVWLPNSQPPNVRADGPEEGAGAQGREWPLPTASSGRDRKV